MNKRIRYQRTTANLLVSRRKFVLPNGVETYVELDLEAKNFRVKDATTEQVIVAGGNTRNVSVLKIQAKRGLTNLGVEFAPETRDRSSSEDTLSGQ